MPCLTARPLPHLVSPLSLAAALLLTTGCYQGPPDQADASTSGPATETDGPGGDGPGDGPGGDGPGGDGPGGDGPGDGPGGDGPGDPPPPPPPELPNACEGLDAQDVSTPRVTIEGADCNESAIREAVEAGGTVVVRCPDAPVMFTEQITIREDTVLDGDGVTTFDGGDTTRLLNKVPGPDLYLQNITLQHGRAPEALGDASVTQANWFEYAGGAILAQCYDNGVDVGGGVYAKNLVCRDNATGSHTRDPQTGQILDTGNGGCIYSFTCPFHCDECDLLDNRATNGGAIGTLGGKTRLTRSRCANNVARYDESDNVNQGCGGCYCQDGTETGPGEDEVNYVEMCGNVFAGNQADENGGAVSLFYRQYTNTRIVFERNDCRDNAATTGAGGCFYVYIDPDTKIPWAPDEGPDTFIVSGNAITANSAETLGGGMTLFNLWQTDVRFNNNQFVGNEVRMTDRSFGGGGALGLLGTFFSIDHCSFIGNVANNWSGGIQLGAGAIELHNNLFFENFGPQQEAGPPSSPAEHINWNLDELDDGDDGGFLVFASAGNLYAPSTGPGGGSRPAPAAAVLDQDPRLGEPSTDAFPPYIPLLPDSPAIDAGVTADGVTVDMHGTARDATPDIGAIEYAP